MRSSRRPLSGNSGTSRPDSGNRSSEATLALMVEAKRRAAAGLSNWICRTMSSKLSRAGRVQTTEARLGIQDFVQLPHRLGMGNQGPLLRRPEALKNSLQQLQPFHPAFEFVNVFQNSRGSAPLSEDDRPLSPLDLGDNFSRADSEIADRREIFR